MPPLKTGPGRQKHPSARLLLIPGLKNSGPVHWQTWLQSLHPTSVRVEQEDWSTPDLDRWALQVGATLDREGPGPWIVAAHGFGVLALARLTKLRPDLPLQAALLVAPTDPERWGLQSRLPRAKFSFPSVLVGSQDDPWMSAPTARLWALLWGSHWLNLGGAGHIDSESGFGAWPFAQHWVVSCSERLEGLFRFEGLDIQSWAFAV